MMPPLPKLSLIIPVGPKDNAWQALLTQLKTLRERCLWPEPLEVLLVSCEPLNIAADINQHLNVQVISTQAGRAHQLNTGAKQAIGEYFWFVHADSQLNTAMLEQVNAFMQSENNQRSIGYFKLAFQQDGPWQTGFNAVGANLRSLLFGLPFGDQTLLVSRGLWQKIGSFNTALKNGEDLDWIVRARLLGFSLQGLAASVYTSARKYQQRGWLKVTAQHLLDTFLQARAAKRRFRQQSGAGLCE